MASADLIRAALTPHAARGLILSAGCVIRHPCDSAVLRNVVAMADAFVGR